MLIIEKVILLRSVSIFEVVPDRLLAEIAERLQEVQVDTGHRLMTEGEIGDALYVLIEGRFGAWRGGVPIAELDGGDVIGELSLLDPEPRSATIVALEPSRLFALRQQDIEDLINGCPEIAFAFIRLLCRRLRSTIERLAALEGAQRGVGAPPAGEGMRV
jgi:CRP-like cAMP-binding protein